MRHQELGQNPLISVSEENKFFVNTLFRKFNFRLSAVKKGIYKSESTEYYFNDARAEAIQNGLIPVLIRRQKQLEKV